MNRSIPSLLLALVALPGVAGDSKAKATPAPAAAVALPDEPMAAIRPGRSDAPSYGFIPRVPYQSGKVYRLVLVPGAPFVVELPLGEAVRTANTDRQWFDAEGDEGSNRLIVHALAADGVETKRSFLHVQSVSGMLYSFSLEVGSIASQPAPGISLYLDGSDREATMRRASNSQAQAQAQVYQGELERRMRSEFNRWKAETLASFKSAYRVDEDGIKVQKVLSNSVQSFVFAPGLTETPSVKLINRDHQEEVLDFEFDNGVYVVNRVLRNGERMVLQAGKAKATVRVD